MWQLMQVYDEAMQLPECEAVHLTRIHREYECDTVFPRLPDAFSLWSAAPPQRDNQDWIEFLCYTRSDCADGPPRLPAGIASQHEERQVHTSLSDSIMAAYFVLSLQILAQSTQNCAELHAPMPQRVASL